MWSRLAKLGVDAEQVTLRQPPKLSPLIRLFTERRTSVVLDEARRSSAALAVSRELERRTVAFEPSVSQPAATLTKAPKKGGGLFGPSGLSFGPVTSPTAFGIGGPSVQRRSFSSIAQIALDPEVQRGARFKAFESMEKAFHEARASKDPAVKAKFVSEAVPAYFSAVADAGGKIDGAHLHDMMNRLSYMNLKPGASFEVEVRGDATGLFNIPSGESRKVKVELTGAYRQPMDFDAIARMPKGYAPSPGFNTWKLTSGEETRTGVVFIGTSSVGRNRDATLGERHATGSLADGAPGGVGHGSVELWTSNKKTGLAAALDAADFVGGHSLGAGVAQLAIEHQLAAGKKAPIGYLASAPGLSTPASEAWVANQKKFLFVHSRQDPITIAGLYSRPGMEIAGSRFDLPVQKGLGNGYGDGLLTQHGAQPATLLMQRDGELPKPTARTGVGPNFVWKGMDQLRQLFSSSAFRETNTEKASRLLDQDGLGSTAKAGKPQGKDHAFNVMLVRDLLNTGLGSTALELNPTGALMAVLSARTAIMKDPAAGLEKLAVMLYKALPSDLMILPKNDLAAIAPSVAKTLEKMT